VIRFVILAVHLLSLALLVVCAVLLIVAGLLLVQFLAIPRPQADKPQALADGLARLRAGDAADGEALMHRAALRLARERFSL
jgi:hypothetical protein